MNYINNVDTNIIIEKDVILNNLYILKKNLHKKTKIAGVLKANAYGLGSYEIYKIIKEELSYVIVSTVEEGVYLRKKKIDTPIIILNPNLKYIKKIIKYKLEPSIFNIINFNIINNSCINDKCYINIHLKIETGMNRVGIKANDLKKIFLSKKSNINIKSIFSHLSTADNLKKKYYVKYQVDKFNYAYSIACNYLDYFPIKHILNSNGCVFFSKYQFDMVRIGIGMYGLISDHKKLKEAISFKSYISNINKLTKGEYLGYDNIFKADKTCIIATIPVGYADGINRQLINKGFVFINKKRAKIIAICMDVIMVNITDIYCNIHDEVFIFGYKSGISIKEFSIWNNTIEYEILTSLSNRIKKIYI